MPVGKACPENPRTSVLGSVNVPMLPPQQCSPNARSHWAVRNRYGREYREAVYYCACAAGRPEKPYEYAELSIIFIVAQRRIRDEDNWKARFKPGQDALVLAGVIAFDDVARLQVRPVRFEVDKDRAPATVIRVKEIMAC